MSRTNKILLTLSKEEFDKIKSKAEKMGMKTATYVRFICLSSIVKVTKNND